MRAVVLPESGAEPRLVDLPEREPGPGQMLVRNHHSSVNGFDAAVVAGWVISYFEHSYPIVLGKDFAGTVEAVGDGVTAFAPGDRVFGVVMAPALGPHGGFAEYVIVDEGYAVARVPDGVGLAVAGALGLAGSAALSALDVLGLKAGQTVLISGATGGVGALAVQYAAATGTRVLATARPGEEAELVLRLGAEQALDYRAGIPEQLRAVAPEGVDAVVHLAGEPEELVGLLAPEGCLASTLLFGADRHQSAISVVADPSRAVLDRLAGDVAAGRVQLPISRTYGLADAPRALAEFSLGTLGKYAIAID